MSRGLWHSLHSLDISQAERDLGHVVWFLSNHFSINLFLRKSAATFRYNYCGPRTTRMDTLSSQALKEVLDMHFLNLNVRRSSQNLLDFIAVHTWSDTSNPLHSKSYGACLLSAMKYNLGRAIFRFRTTFLKTVTFLFRAQCSTLMIASSFRSTRK